MMGNVKRPRVSASEEFAAVVRKAVRCHSEWKETKGCPLFIRSQRRGAFPELRVKLFQCIVKRICIYGADPFLRGKFMGDISFTFL